MTLGVFVWVAETDPTGACPNKAPTPAILDLEFAGTTQRAEAILECWDRKDRRAIEMGLDRDTYLIILYSATLMFWCGWGAVRSRTGRNRGLGFALLALVPLAGVLDFVENHYLREVLNEFEKGGQIDRHAVEHALTATLPKWVIVVTALIYAVIAFVVATVHVATIGWRLVRRRPRFANSSVPDPRQREPNEEAWRWASKPPRKSGWSSRRDRDPADPVGVCLSGGGIRSAVFNLGVLQVLRRARISARPGEKSVLASTDYLAAVSGGAYMAGAVQMLLHRWHREHASTPQPAAFAPRTPEEDHMRRHGRYLADSPSEWMHALFRALTGLVLNLAVFVVLIYVIARPIGWLQRDLLFELDDAGDLVPHTTTGMWSAVIMLGLASFILVLLAILSRPLHLPRHKLHGYLWRGAAGLAALGLAVLAFVWLLPFLARAVHTALEAPFTESSGDEKKETLFGIVVVSSAGALASVLATFQALTNRFKGRVGRVLLRLSGFLLALFALVLFANLVDDAARLGPRGSMPFFHVEELTAWLVAGAALLVLYALFDQTQWSLHPLYKRRLATAFSIERVDSWKARKIDDDIETTLSGWGTPIEGFPELIVCGAANVSGDELSPPGRRALSFTFAHDYVGGPEVGWARTVDFETVLGPRNRGDGTLLAAVAISGAAFASAMGQMSKPWRNVLLAVSNARLGVWLPSPKYVNELRGLVRSAPQRGLEPWVRTRRFTYLLREVFGIYDPDDRFVYVTDGGHIDNLGLVELLRRRCRLILCFDASGDSPDFTGTLAGVVALAREQLGVEVDIRTDDLAPASATTPEGPNQARNELSKRTSKTTVAVGTISYPDIGNGAGSGTLIFAKAVLDADLPLDVQYYANGTDDFPNDPTSDQFFDHRQFAAYHELGTFIAEQAVKHLS